MKKFLKGLSNSDFAKSIIASGLAVVNFIVIVWLMEQSISDPILFIKMVAISYFSIVFAVIGAVHYVFYITEKGE